MKKTILLITTMLLGCATARPELAVPTSFVQVDGDPYDVRLTTAQGVVLGVRAFDNAPYGDLGFWSAAVDAQARQRYEATAREEIETESGVAGVRIRYRGAHAGRPHVYWATVFVTERRVLLVEAGGDEAHFGEREAELEAAIRSLRL